MLKLGKKSYSKTYTKKKNKKFKKIRVISNAILLNFNNVILKYDKTL